MRTEAMPYTRRCGIQRQQAEAGRELPAPLGCLPACLELALAAQSRCGANIGSLATRQGDTALFCGAGAVVTAAPGHWFRGSAQMPFSQSREPSGPVAPASP